MAGVAVFAEEQAAGEIQIQAQALPLAQAEQRIAILRCAGIRLEVRAIGTGGQPLVAIGMDQLRFPAIETPAGEETLATPIGEFRTLVFRSTRPGSDTGTYFWCAPALGFLPVKVERREGAKVQWSMSLVTASTG